MQRSIKRLFERKINIHNRRAKSRHIDWLALIGLSFGLCMPAVADSTAQTGLNPLLTGGLTVGGETIMTAYYTTGQTMKVRAGNFVQVGVGVQWRMENTPLALALTANYHGDHAAASNGFGEFVRYPLEAIMYYVGDDWRFGLGARRVLLPEARLKNNDTTYDVLLKFSDANGVIAEIGYAATENLWLNFRVVREQYRGETLNVEGVIYDARSLKYDGSHVGVNFTYIF